jgi:cell division protein FtsW
VLLSPACASFDQFSSYRGAAARLSPPPLAGGAAVSRAAVASAPVWLLPDRLLLVIAVALLAVGLVAISSASVGYAEAHYGDMWHHTLRHAIYLALALGARRSATRLPVAFWYRSGWLWLLLVSLLLILVLVPGVGRNVNGSQRWLALGPLTLQPSELAKAAVLLYLAGYLVRQEAVVRERWQGFIRPLIVLGLLVGAAARRAGFRRFRDHARHGPGHAVSRRHATAALRPHSLRLRGTPRLGCSSGRTVPPAAPDCLHGSLGRPFGSGFQLIQSLIAFGRGEWLGVGLGNSVQKLFYLPEAHTDFVFSIWAEETGFAGAAIADRAVPGAGAANSRYRPSRAGRR